ncbi:MAG: hypothetical protein AB7U49_11885 [Hyphomicrobiaceae bacterium]
MALFDRQVAIRSALRDLEANGVDLGAAQVVASTSAPSFDYTQAANAWPRIAESRLDVERFGAAGALAHVHAIARRAFNPRSARPAFDTLRPSEVGSRLGHGGALSRQGQRLHDHLIAGGFALVVPIAGGTDPATVCSILLHYATGSVQTHQVRSTSWIEPESVHA